MWSDHSFAGLVFSFAFTFAQPRPLWRFMFFSNRACKVPSKSSHCFADNFLFVSTPFIAVRLNCCAVQDHQPNFSRSQRTLTTQPVQYQRNAGPARTSHL